MQRKRAHGMVDGCFLSPPRRLCCILEGDVSDSDMRKLEYALDACKGVDPFAQEVVVHDTVLQVVFLALWRTLLAPHVPSLGRRLIGLPKGRQKKSLLKGRI